MWRGIKVTYFRAFVVFYLTCGKMLRIYKQAYEIGNIEYACISSNCNNVSERLLEYTNVTESCLFYLE